MRSTIEPKLRMALDEAHATSNVRDTLVAIWRGEPTPERLGALADQLRAVAQRSSGRVYLYNVITPETRVPSPAARSALQSHFISMRGQLIAAAIVLEKTGAQGALSRAILKTLLTITRQPFPMRVFSVRKDALAWLASQGCGAHPNALATLTDQLWRQLQLTEPGE